MPTSFVVRDEPGLNAAIAAVSTGGADAQAGAAYTITIDATGSFDLATDLSPIALPVGASLTISGDVDMDGHGLVHGFSIESGSVTFADLSVSGTFGIAAGDGWAVDAAAGTLVLFADADFPHFNGAGAAGSTIRSKGPVSISSTGGLDLGSISIEAQSLTATAVGALVAPSLAQVGGGELVATGSISEAGTLLAVSSASGPSPALVVAIPAHPADVFVVSSEAELRAAITALSIGGIAEAASNAYTITLAGDISLSADLPAIDPGGTDTLLIQGNGHVLSGGGVARGFYVYSGIVTFRDLTIADAVAKGGDGQAGSHAGGGAGGLGGGLFIADHGVAILDGVDFRDDSAVGGAGGAWANPAMVPMGTDTVPAAGFGFGGGGAGIGGQGGFGGGGGGGGTAGQGGFGAGNGGAGPLGAGGGGGIAGGADIFVHAGGGLAILSGTLDAGTLTPGTGTDGGGDGQAYGSSIFLSGGQVFALTPAAGQTVVVNGVIADTSVPGEPAGTQTQFSGGSSSTGSAGSTISITFPFDPVGWVDPYVVPAEASQPAAGGTVVLNAANTYASGTRATGTLELGNAASAGTGAIRFDAYGTTLRVHGADAPANQLNSLATGDVLDFTDIALVPGFTPVVAGQPMIVPGQPLVLSRSGGGTIALAIGTEIGAHLAALASPDGTGGARVRLVSVATIPGAGGTSFIPMGNGAYAGAAQSVIGAGGAASIDHAGGAITLGAGLFASDATAPLHLTGGDANGQLIVTGTADLTYAAGAGSATLVAGGGNNLIDLRSGAGDQIVYLGNGADTVWAGNGNATIDGNAGGKLVMLGAGTTRFISHAGTQTAGGAARAADTVVAGTTPAYVASHGNLLATGQFGALTLDPAAGTSSLIGVTGHVQISPDSGGVYATTAGTLAVDGATGATTILGSAAAARLLVSGAAVADPHALIAAGAGSMTVSGYFAGTLQGGSAGGNVFRLTGGSATISGTRPGDVVSLGGTASGTVFGNDTANFFDGSGGSGAVTWVSAAGATTLVTGSGANTAWLGAGSAVVVSQGGDSIMGGGDATVFGLGGGLVQAGGGDLLFVGGAGPGVSSIIGGAGDETVFAGVKPIHWQGSDATGGLLFIGGSQASTVIGGAGRETLFGGTGGGVFGLGDADGNIVVTDAASYAIAAGAGHSVVYGNAGANITFTGDATQTGNLLVAGAGAETINAAASQGNVFFASAGDATLSGSATGGDAFEFFNQGPAAAAHSVTITNFDPAGITQNLVFIGYGFNLANTHDGTPIAGPDQAIVAGSTHITLSDHTTIILQDYAAPVAFTNFNAIV